MGRLNRKSTIEDDRRVRILVLPVHRRRGGNRKKKSKTNEQIEAADEEPSWVEADNDKEQKQTIDEVKERFPSKKRKSMYQISRNLFNFDRMYQMRECTKPCICSILTPIVRFLVLLFDCLS